MNLVGLNFELQLHARFLLIPGHPGKFILRLFCNRQSLFCIYSAPAMAFCT